MMFKSLLCVSAASLLLVGCSDTSLGSKSFTESLDPLIIPGAPISFGELTLPDIKFPLDLQDQEGYESLDIVTSVKVQSAIFTISSDTDDPNLDQFADNNADNFDFLSSIVLSLEATIDGTKQTVQVASVPDGDPQIGSNAATLSLTLIGVDIRDYVEAPDVQLVVSATGTVPPDSVVIDPVIRFKVGIGVR